MIFNAVVVSRLLYGLSGAWLNKSEIRRLNGFQSRCLRVLLRIPPSYISRILNSTVLQSAKQLSLGDELLKQQLLLFGRIARAPQEDPVRKVTFIGNTLEPATGFYIRRVG